MNLPEILEMEINKNIMRQNHRINNNPIHQSKSLIPYNYYSQPEEESARYYLSITWFEPRIIRQEINRMIKVSSGWKRPHLENLLKSQKEFNASFYFLALCHLNANKNISLLRNIFTDSFVRYIEDLHQDLFYTSKTDKIKLEINNEYKDSLENNENLKYRQMRAQFKNYMSTLLGLPSGVVSLKEIKEIIYLKTNKLMNANKSPFYGIGNTTLSINFQDNQAQQFITILFNQHKALIDGKLPVWPPQSGGISLIENTDN